MIELSDVLAARTGIGGQLLPTPSLFSRVFSERSGAEAFLEIETAQLTGWFEIRGAPFKVLALEPDELAMPLQP